MPSGWPGERARVVMRDDLGVGQGMKPRALPTAVAFLLACSGLGDARSQSEMDAVSRLPKEQRDMILSACSLSKYSGPAAYYSCLDRQIAALQKSPNPPTDQLSRLSKEERDLILSACSLSKYSGPAAYHSCLDRQIAALQKNPLAPTEQLSRLSKEERDMILSACSLSKYSGPAAYYSCLDRQVAALGSVRQEPRGDRKIDRPGPTSMPAAGSAEVAKAQRALSELGYDPGPVDGQWGRRTYSALVRFQSDKGIVPADGHLSAATLEALEAAVGQHRASARSAATAETERAPSITPAPSPAKWAAMKSRVLTSEGSTDQGAQRVFAAVKGSIWTVIAGKTIADVQAVRNLAQGSAVAVSGRLLLTNCHVLDGRAVLVLVQGDAIDTASLVSSSPDTDRCILRAKTLTLLPIRFIRSSKSVQIGERAYTVGAPSGLELTIGEGIVSGVRARAGVTYLQSSAPISSGSSGGGLFDGEGKLIGITTFRIRDGQALNFAIAADEYWRD